MIDSDCRTRLERIAAIIQKTFDAEPKDGELERIYHFDSLVRSQVDTIFIRNEYAERDDQQWLIDVTLQLIAIRLLNLFDDQEGKRNQFQYYAHSVRTLAKRGMRSHLIEEKEVINSIEIWKAHFHELLELAKGLAFEVFERQAYQYHLYRVLNLKR